MMLVLDYQDYTSVLLGGILERDTLIKPMSQMSQRGEDWNYNPGCAEESIKQKALKDLNPGHTEEVT